jgi:hypothetical protein
VADLVPVKKEVVRLGATYTQTYWVKAEELRTLVARGDYDGAVRMAGGDPTRVRQLISGWKTVPGGERDATLRGALHKAFDNEAMMEHDADRLVASYRAGPQLTREAMSAGAADAELVKSVQALAQVSQALFPEPTVTLYRGVGAAQAREARSGNIRTDGASSFTTSPSIARRFAGKSGAVLEFQVPREAIAIAYEAVPELRKPMGELYENEVVVVTRGAMQGKVRPPASGKVRR